VGVGVGLAVAAGVARRATELRSNPLRTKANSTSKARPIVTFNLCKLVFFFIFCLPREVSDKTKGSDGSKPNQSVLV
jgi:hypothetical protein